MGHNIAVRSFAIHAKSIGISTDTISESSGLSKRTINRIYERALEKGFEPGAPWNVTEDMVADAPRSGRPKKQSLDM
ncbi:hypothetical protein N7491_004754 [Penicillium cf. griseofulvum]|uniref:Uncharacterized protein n=1 Tax=Penicillium cf. griseofulvum TaxID=2972120 RepID=A0A9W9J0J0_9EURO|nr:hypothetical protein N7472_007443 [Penicillium cf. griseofulvum]KAJ5434159.1 hypothetical protein N7491_004754 [Penicillium cf. griseofulvum]KAJ5451986.1 hypothetical protein N7445_000169 [Penicillium cf. griseofulvum]